VTTSAPHVSIVVPLYNEEDNVEPLADAIRDALREWPVTWEALLVDDGSRDRTQERAGNVHRDDPRFRYLRLRRNSGQTAAMAVGFARSRGEVIVSMDGDLQNDPRDIPTIVARLDDGFDVVCGWRKDRKDDFVMRTFPSMVANKLLAWVTGVPIHDNGCSLKAYRASVIQSLRLYSEMHRFLPALSSMTGARIDEVVVRHHPRIHGTSKYGISRTFKVLADMVTIKMITRFSSRPGTWFALLALPFLGLALLSALIAVSGRGLLEGGPSIVFPSLSLVFFYLVGHLMTLSVLAELLLNKSDRRDLKRMTTVLAVTEERWDEGPRPEAS